MGKLIKLKTNLNNLIGEKIKYRNSIFTVKNILTFTDFEYGDIECVSLEDQEGYVANFDMNLVKDHFEII